MIVIIIPLSANSIFAEKEIEVSTTSFENSGIIEFHNYSEFQIKTIRMWLNNENSFESFKVGDEWDIKKTENGVLVLTLRDGNTENTSVKIGIVTNVKSNGVNWKVINENGEIVKTDITPWKQSIKKTKQSVNIKNINKFENAQIRFVPEKIRLDSNFRIIGEKFESDKTADLFIGNQKIKSIYTDSNGRFVDTINISGSIKSERNNVVVKDANGNTKEMSVRVYDPLNRIRESITIPLSIDSIPEQLETGEILKILGESTPEKDVTITITDEIGNIETTEVITVNSKGVWAFEKEINDDISLGEKSIRIEDGKSSQIIPITIITDKKIQIQPRQMKYEPGDEMIFEGSAIPEQELEAILEDPKGTVVFSDVIRVDSSGYVLISYETTKSFKEGTYVLSVSQKNESEIILVGLGVLPEQQLIIKTNGLNYSTTDKLIITIRGESKSTVNLLIIDPSDKEKMSEAIKLDQSGYASYELELKGYSSGAYTAVISRGGAQDSVLFTVGLQTGSGPISASLTKETFKPTESILVIGNTGKNTILTLSLINPDNEIVKVTKTFTDKDGKFANEEIRIPVSAPSGVWKLNIKSGGNYTEMVFEVLNEERIGIIIQLDNTEFKHEEIITLSGSGAIGNRVFVSVSDPNGNEVIQLDTPIKDDGTFTIPWKVSTDNEAGEYKVEVRDSSSSSTIIFTIVD